MADIHALEVGKPYNPGRRIWPECAQYNYRGNQHELVLFYGRPEGHEVEEIAKGQAEFALYLEGELLVFLFRFGGAGAWSDAPFSIYLVPDEQRTLPPAQIPEDKGAGLLVFLVDAATGILRAMRLISLGAKFSLALHQAILAQAGMRYNESGYSARLAALYQRADSDMLAQLAQHRVTIPARSV